MCTNPHCRIVSRLTMQACTCKISWPPPGSDYTAAPRCSLLPSGHAVVLLHATKGPTSFADGQYSSIEKTSKCSVAYPCTTDCQLSVQVLYSHWLVMQSLKILRPPHRYILAQNSGSSTIRRPSDPGDVVCAVCFEAC